MTISDVLRSASERLTRAGVDTPRLDAEVLLACALGVDRTALALRLREDAPDDGGGNVFWQFVQRREAREPVAYITGRREFRRLSLAVDRRVLIPRPETELLVEVGLGLDRGACVVDVGTGSGAVALALKDERPDLSVTGVDISADALDVARANAARLGLEVRFVRGDLLAGIEDVDAVLANPPYIEDGAELAPEIERYEPREALFAGRDGLGVIRRLLGQVQPAHVVAIEIGLGQGDSVASLLRAAGLGRVERLRDLAGIERVVVGRR